MTEMTAFMLIKVQDGTLDRAVQELHELQGIKKIYRVLGKYDLITIIKGETATELTDYMVKVEMKDYIEKTNSLFGNEV